MGQDDVFKYWFKSKTDKQYKLGKKLVYSYIAKRIYLTVKKRAKDANSKTKETSLRTAAIANFDELTDNIKEVAEGISRKVGDFVKPNGRLNVALKTEMKNLLSMPVIETYLKNNNLNQKIKGTDTEITEDSLKKAFEKRKPDTTSTRQKKKDKQVSSESEKEGKKESAFQIGIVKSKNRRQFTIGERKKITDGSENLVLPRINELSENSVKQYNNIINFLDVNMVTSFNEYRKLFHINLITPMVILLFDRKNTRINDSDQLIHNMIDLAQSKFSTVNAKFNSPDGDTKKNRESFFEKIDNIKKSFFPLLEATLPKQGKHSYNKLKEKFDQVIEKLKQFSDTDFVENEKPKNTTNETETKKKKHHFLSRSKK